MPRWPPRATRSARGLRCPDMPGRVISTRWRAPSRSTRGCSRFSKAWTTASRSARPAISTSRPSPDPSPDLGGKSSFIVFDDADVDSVVEGVVDAIWFNQGQVCCAGSRLLAHEGIAERLVTKLRARMEKLRVGPPLDKAIDMGAIVAPVQLERIRQLVSTGVAEGATMWQPSWACPTEGYFRSEE